MYNWPFVNNLEYMLPQLNNLVSLLFTPSFPSLLTEFLHHLYKLSGSINVWPSYSYVLNGSFSIY